MNTVSCYFQAAVAAMIVTSASVAGESHGTAASLDRTGAPPPLKVRPGQERDGLDLRRPYERGEIPVVMIHGLWGKPQLWGQMIAELDADPALRRKYQFWTFRYASGDAIPYSAHQLRQSLRRARRTFDPEGTDAAFDRMVVVGHSLGGILAKMMVQESGPRLWQTVCERPIDQLAGPAEERRLLEQAFCYSPVPEVRSVIFITTPHRGSPLATSPVRGIAKQLCDRPSRFLRALEIVQANNKPDRFTPQAIAENPTSASELVPGHPLLSGLCGLNINPSAHCHSIIADLHDPPSKGGSDGIVPYSSSHLDGVDSELLVHGLHICLNHPAVIREVRRILVEHAQQ
jgi:pimeloyl-ACP methyl ester carboxylesterase